MKKDIDLLPYSCRVVYIAPVIYNGVAGTVEIDLLHSDFHYGSKYFNFRIISSKRNPNYKKFYFRFRGDTYYFFS